MFRKLLHCLLGVLLAWFVPVALRGAPGTPPPPEYFFKHLPETNPYRAIIARLNSAPHEDQAALRAWSDPGSAPDAAPATPLTEAQQKLANDLAASLVAAAAHPALSSGDWPLQMSDDDPNNLYAGVLPEQSSLRTLARIGTRIADEQPAIEAVPTYAAVAQLARQQRTGLLIIQQLTAAALEETAISAIARRLQDFDADTLRQLETCWAGLLPSADPHLCLQNEQDVGFAFFIESILRPALHELLGPETQTTDTAHDETRATFTRNLRLSGLIDLGGGEYQISLEDVAAGTSFAVSTQKPAEGIRLVRIDFDAHQALIRRGTREAVVHLQAKTITELPFKPVRDPVGFFDIAWDLRTPEGREARAAFLDSVRKHPGGIEGYIAEITARYPVLLRAQIASAQQAAPAKAPPATDGKNSDPMRGILTPAFGGTLRTLNGALLRNDMLHAAIHHRLTQLGAASAASPPADPWSADSSSFIREPTPDGGFLLRSRYETRPDAPLTYKFAAPDAGLVRPK